MPRIAFVIHQVTTVEFEAEITDDEYNECTASGGGAYNVAKKIMWHPHRVPNEIRRDTEDQRDSEIIDAGTVN